MPTNLLRSGTLLLVTALAACSSIPPVGEPGNEFPTRPMPSDQIRWPEAYEPEKATFNIVNEIEVEAPPEDVWNLLVRAGEWPDWYEGASNVQLLDSTSDRLAADSQFSWRTMDQDLVTNVVEFTPPFRMGWESRKSTLKAYHAWLLIPTATGTRIVTEESQYGWLAFLQSVFVPNELSDLHDIWLAAIKQRVEPAADPDRE